MVLACLRAAEGNPDMAMEFLTNGIPPTAQSTPPTAASAPTSTTPSSSSPGEPLQALRNHPQFDSLRRLVQSNPQALQAVLAQIGQQQPQLLEEINANQAAFLRMMNEPVAENAQPTASSNAPTGSGSSSSTENNAGAAAAAAFPGLAGALGGMGGGLDGMANPQQVAQFLQSMGPAELQNIAHMMGVTPEQLRASAQMIGSLPPEQLQQILNMGGTGGFPGLGPLGGAGGGGPGGPGGSQVVVRLSEADVAAVNRLAAMGFDRTEATQAYLACDRNEELAANLLMDGGFGFGDGPDGAGEGGGDGGDDTDQMYD